MGIRSVSPGTLRQSPHLNELNINTLLANLFTSAKLCYWLELTQTAANY